MIENSRIINNSLILYIRLIIVSIFGLLSARFILQALGASDFGLFNVVGGLVFMIALLNNVMVSTTYRFIAFELGTGDKNRINKIFNLSLVIHILLAFLVIIFAQTIGVYYIRNYLNVAAGKLDDAVFVFRLSILSTFFSILSVPYQGLIIAKERFSVTAAVEIFRSLLALMAVITLLFYEGNRLRQYAFLISLISILPSILYFLYSRYRFTSIIEWNLQKDISKYKPMLSFSGWIMFGAAASAGEIQGSALLINRFFGTMLNASFGIANQVNNIIFVFAQSLNKATIPQITKSYSSGNTERTMKLVIFSSKYAFLLMLIPSIPILLETDFILKLWLKTVPIDTAIFIKIMIINALITTMNAGIPAAVQATGNIKYFQIILSSLALLGLPISYIFFRLGFPSYFLLLVYTVISISNFFILNVLLKRLLHFNIKEFFYKGYLKMIMVFISILPLFLLIKMFHSNLQRFIGITSASLIWTLASIYLLGMDQNEKEFVIGYIRKSVHYIHRKRIFD